MTITDYSSTLNERLYRYLEAKLKQYKINPLILRFSLIVEPIKNILNTPLITQDGSKSFRAQERIELNYSRFYSNKVKEYLDKLSGQSVARKASNKC